MSLLDNLVSFWKMDETSGNALDAHGSNPLTANGALGIGSGTGKINTARTFASTYSQYFSHSDNADLSTGDIDFTFAFWMQVDNTSDGNAFVVKWQGGLGSREYLIWTASSAHIQFAVSSDGGGTQQTVDSTSSVSASTWYHVVAWHDSVNNQIGISVNDGTPVTASWSSGVYSGIAEFRIGEAFGGYLNGRVDEVGFWKRVLTSTERTQLYNSGAGLAYPFTVSNSGTLSVTLDALTLSATGGVPATNGTLTVLLSDLSGTGTGGVPRDTGSLTTNLDALTGTGTGTVSSGATLNGTLNATLDPVSSVATGSIILRSSLTVTLDPLTLAATGSIPSLASLTVTLDTLTLAATGLTGTPVSGLLDALLSDLVLSATLTSSATVQGALGAVFDDLVVVSQGISGSIPGPLPAGTIVDEGKPSLLRAKIAFLSTCRLGLYTNAVAWYRPRVLAEIVQADWPGYGSAPVPTWSDPLMDASGRAVTQTPPIEFSNDGPDAVHAHGWFLFSLADDVLIGGGRFTGGPREILPGGTLRIVASVTDTGG